MTKKQTEFSTKYIKKLGEFVKEEKKNGLKMGLSVKEIDAIMTTTFNMLGKYCKEFRKNADMK